MAASAGTIARTGESDLSRLGNDEVAITSYGGNASRIETRLAAAVNLLRDAEFKYAGAGFGSVNAMENHAKDKLMRLVDERMHERKRNNLVSLP